MPDPVWGLMHTNIIIAVFVYPAVPLANSNNGKVVGSPTAIATITRIGATTDNNNKTRLIEAPPPPRAGLTSPAVSADTARYEWLQGRAQLPRIVPMRSSQNS